MQTVSLAYHEGFGVPVSYSVTEMPDDPEDDQLVDHSGVFRVTSRLAQTQTAREEDASLRFASDSLVMRAQRDGFRDDGPTIDDAVDETAIVDEAATVAKRQRLTALAAQIQARAKRSRC